MHFIYLKRPAHSPIRIFALNVCANFDQHKTHVSSIINDWISNSIKTNSKRMFCMWRDTLHLNRLTGSVHLTNVARAFLCITQTTHEYTVRCTRAAWVELIQMKKFNACLQMKCKHGIRNSKHLGVRWTHGSVLRIGKTSKCVVMKISHSFDGWTLDHWTFRCNQVSHVNYLDFIPHQHSICTRISANVHSMSIACSIDGNLSDVRFCFESVSPGDFVSCDDKKMQFLWIFFE